MYARMGFLLGLGGLMCFGMVEARAATYYVAKNGNDNNPGTSARPWLTVQKAANTLRAGDTVLIKQGTYVGRVSPQRGGTSTSSRIHYKAFPGHNVVIDGNGANQAFLISASKPADYLHIDGLHFTNGRSGLFVEKHKHILIENVKAYKNKQFGIYLFNESSQIIIRKSHMYENEQAGLYISTRCSEVLVDDIESNNNGVAGSGGGEGIRLYGNGNAVPATVENRRIIIQNSDIHDNYRQGLQTQMISHLLLRNNRWYKNGATGIQIETHSRYVVIDGNTAEDNNHRYFGEYGIWLDETIYAVVQNNTIRRNQGGLGISQSHHVIARFNRIYSNQGQAIPAGACSWCPGSLGGISVGIGRETHKGAPVGATHNAFVHQVLYDNGGAKSNWGAFRILNDDKRIANNLFLNNAIYQDNSKYVLSFAGAAAFDRFDYNLFFNGRALLFKWGAKELAFKAYQSASTYDAHSHSARPLFADAAKADFQPQKGSPTIDAGSFLTTTASAGSGTTMKVKDARFFADGYGGIHAGDMIQLQGDTATVQVEKVDYKTHTLTLSRRLTWRANQGVSYPYQGKGPDQGIYEYKVPAPRPEPTAEPSPEPAPEPRPEPSSELAPEPRSQEPVPEPSQSPDPASSPDASGTDRGSTPEPQASDPRTPEPSASPDSGKGSEGPAKGGCGCQQDSPGGLLVLWLLLLFGWLVRPLERST